LKSKLPEQLNFLSNRNAEQKKTSASLKGKMCIINGATSGVGLSALKYLVDAGADIVMLARDLKKAEKAKDSISKQNNGVNIDILYSDFSELETVRKVSETILKNYPRIDLLINSAGIFCTSRTLTSEGLEIVFCINHLAPFLLVRLLMERLKESAPARIIHVNSQGHRFNGLDIDDLNWDKRMFNGYKSYGASKTAQLLTTWELADLLKGSGVTINAMHPGAVKTNIGNNNGPLYRWYNRHIIWHFLDDPKISGEALYYLAASPEMEDISGRYFNLTIDEKPAIHALDRKMAKKVWEISENLTNFH
jgi:NAD(P)-dependent dehydrogenase (short-subunit alcohol dehydrogenase family)